MPVPVPFLRACAFGCACAFLAGCGPSYFFNDLRTRYQQVEVPNAFSDGKPGFSFTGYAARNTQRAARFGVDTARYEIDFSDDTTRIPMREEYALDRMPETLGGSFFYSDGENFVGALGGVSSPDLAHPHFGLMGGWAPRYGGFSPLFVGAFCFNRVTTRGDYYHTIDFLGSQSFEHDTSSKDIWDISWPFKLGLMYHVGPVAPYVTVSRGASQFWPINSGDDDFIIYHKQASFGLLISGPRGISLDAEAARDFADIPTRFRAEHWSGRAGIRFDLR